MKQPMEQHSKSRLFPNRPSIKAPSAKSGFRARLVRGGLILALATGWGPLTCLASGPVMTNAVLLPSGQVQIQIQTQVGQGYAIEVSTNLVNWSLAGNFNNVSTNLLTVADPTPVSSFARRFYRVHVGTEARYTLNFHFHTFGGHFGGGFTPVVPYPVGLGSYTANFSVSGDTNYPSPTNVFFTGPAGSGLSGAVANTNNSFQSPTDATYQSPNVSSPPSAPPGTWVVNYNGSNFTFNVADPQTAAHLLVPVPTVLVSGDVLQSVSWTYKDATTGSTLGGAPSFMTSIQVQIDGIVGNRIYNSPNNGLPSTTTHVLTSTVNWSNVQAMYMAYYDALGNSYIISYSKP